MDEKQIRDELWEIAKAYPTLAGLLSKSLGDSGTKVGSHWVKLIQAADLNAVHYQNLCDEYASLEKPLPEPSDQLVFEIVRECKDRRAKDIERYEQQVKYHDQQKYKGRGDDNWYRWMHWIIGRKEKLTDEQVEDMCQWTNHDGVKPEWIGEEVTA